MMPCPPAPWPPPESVLRKRWANGARTVRELDPEFAEWCDARRREAKFALVTCVFGTIALFFLGIVVGVRLLTS